MVVGAQIMAAATSSGESQKRFTITQRAQAALFIHDVFTDIKRHAISQLRWAEEGGRPFEQARWHKIVAILEHPLYKLQQWSLQDEHNALSIAAYVKSDRFWRKYCRKPADIGSWHHVHNLIYDECLTFIADEHPELNDKVIIASWNRKQFDTFGLQADRMLFLSVYLLNQEFMARKQRRRENNHKQKNKKRPDKLQRSSTVLDLSAILKNR